jgi:hypothetical protein
MPLTRASVGELHTHALEKEPFMRTLMRITGVALLLASIFVPRIAAAAVTGAIEGTVTDQATGKRLAGVTVTVTSPALQGEQTEFTDGTGHFIITELPPGEYLVRFYFADKTVERPGVFLQADKTLAVNVAFPTQEATVRTYRINEKAPSVDVGNTQVQTQITTDLVRNTPVRGRTFDAVLELAPGATTDDIGFSFNGATGNENNYLIDGLNTTNGAFGILGTQLTLEFIGETEIITGGYNAEYGRATGGVVNVITKSGSNQFHGGLWFYATPFELTPVQLGRPGESVVSSSRLKYDFDVGFDLGGPIVKDKVWFYVGFAPTFTTTTTDVFYYKRLANNDTGSMTAERYAGDVVPNDAACPAWLAKGFCNYLSGGYSFAMEKLSDQYTRHYDKQVNLYNWIAKLNFQLNQNNSLSLQYIGSPETQSGPIDATIGASAGPTFAGSDGQLLASRFTNTHDVIAHFVSKLADRRLQLDLRVGYHMEDQELRPNGAVGGNDINITYQNEMNLSDFRPEIGPCARTTTAAGNLFYPCPVTFYVDGGWGIVDRMTGHRIAATAAATYFARLGGTHAVKVGLDFEDNIYRHFRRYTGAPNGGFILTDPSEGFPLIREQFASRSSGNPTDNAILLQDGLTATTQAINFAAYLRDSYNVGFIPGLTVNAGVRWEGQQLTDLTGGVKIGIYDNWAPRVGAIWDFTRKGRGKLFASYGWFYESIPIDIADRSFSKEGFAHQEIGRSSCAPDAVDANGRITKIQSCDFGTIQNQKILGGQFAPVAPNLKGQYSEEVVAGIQYDVGFDIVLGASYIHRNLGRVIEDVSPDGAQTYLITNPGEGVDEGVVRDLQRQIDAAADPAEKAVLQQKLQLYEQINTGFPKPTRTYNALVLTATKRLSHNFLLLASYTYSRTLGNYPGLYQPSNGQTDPNISTQYDFRELVVNRTGPLPNDRPHNIKVQGSYFVPFGKNQFVFGLGFNAQSGAPIEVLGASSQIGGSEVFILPRGSGGRTPWVTQFDLHASYSRKLSETLGFEVYWDVFNVLNQRAVVAVDQEYTYSEVRPIQNGTVADLAGLKTLGGMPAEVNPNYGSPVWYQTPLSMRFGARLSF